MVWSVVVELAKLFVSDRACFFLCLEVCLCVVGDLVLGDKYSALFVGVVWEGWTGLPSCGSSATILENGSIVLPLCGCVVSQEGVL